MAKVRLFGRTFSATPVEKLPNGNWVMTANEHTARCTPGSEIEVTPAEIVEMSAAEMPSASEVAASQAQLEQGMAAGRDAIPTVAELLAKAPKTVEDAGR